MKPYCLVRYPKAEKIEQWTIVRDEGDGESMPSQVLFKLAEDPITCFVRQVVDFEETGVVTNSNRPPIIVFVCPSQFCISTAFIFSWDHIKSQEKMETVFMQNFGGTKKEYYGIFESGL